jgi:hypothetical protein
MSQGIEFRESRCCRESPASISIRSVTVTPVTLNLAPAPAAEAFLLASWFHLAKLRAGPSCRPARSIRDNFAVPESRIEPTASASVVQSLCGKACSQIGALIYLDLKPCGLPGDPALSLDKAARGGVLVLRSHRIAAPSWHKAAR